MRYKKKFRLLVASSKDYDAEVNQSGRGRKCAEEP